MDGLTSHLLPPSSEPPTGQDPPAEMTEYATFGARFGARFIDALVTLVVCAVGGAVAYGVATAGSDGTTTDALVAYVVAAQVTGAIALYYLLGYSRDRRTVGYSIVGLALRRTNGSPVGFWHTFGRWLLAIVSWLPFGLGYLAPLWTDKRQTFHDSLAGTVVVRASGKGRGVAVAFGWFLVLTLAQGVGGGLVGKNLIDEGEVDQFQAAPFVEEEGEADWGEGTNECFDEDSGQFSIDVNGVTGQLQPRVELDINDTCGSRREFSQGWVFFEDEYGCEGSGTFDFDEGLRIAPYDTVTVAFEFIETDCRPSSSTRVKMQVRESATTTDGLSPSFLTVRSSGPADIPNPFDESSDTSVTEPDRDDGEYGDSFELAPASVYAPPASTPAECASDQGSFTAENLIDGDLSTKWAFESDVVGRRFEFEFQSPVHLTSVSLAGFGQGSCGGLGAEDFRSITGVRWTFEDGSTVRHSPTATSGLDSMNVDVVTSTVTMDITGTDPGVDGLEPSFLSEVAFEGQDTDEQPDVPEVDGQACDPPEQIGHGVEVVNLENDKFQIVVCENGGELLYFGHSKGDLGSIVLEAEATNAGYLAMNGVYAYEVSTGDSARLRVSRGDEELTSQALFDAG